MQATVQENVVSLVWEIRDFLLYMKLYQGELESPPFSIRCNETISWFLTTKASANMLHCYLHRQNKVDDLGDIRIKWRVFVKGDDGSMYFSRISCAKLGKSDRSLEMLYFLDANQLRREHMADGTLRLQCNLDIAINDNLSASCNESLESLSRDMLELYDSGEYSNKVLRVNCVNFRVHSFVIGARCPGLSSFDPEGVSITPPVSNPSRRTKKYPGIASLMELLKLPPKSSFVYRPARLCPATEKLSQRFKKTFNRHVCDALLRYLYAGRIAPVESHEKAPDNDMRLRLLIAARHYDLWDLSHRLGEVESKTMAITKLMVKKVTVDFDLDFIANHRNVYFEPITRLVNLSVTGRQYMLVTFSVVKDISMLHVSCQMIESKLPITVKSEICVFHSSYMDDPLETFTYIKRVCFQGERWSPPIEVTSRRNVRLKCTFSVCTKDKVEISQQEFSLSSTAAAESRSLRQLSNDFATAMTRTTKVGDNLTDLILVAKRKELRVHRHIVLGRVPKFRRKMSSSHKKHMRKYSPKTLVLLIEYIYTGLLLQEDTKSVEKLLEVARTLRLPKLENICTTFLEGGGN